MSEQNRRSQESSAEKVVSDEAILKIAKEISVKFIEMGRITPASFDSTFEKIYTTIERTVRDSKNTGKR
jgi:hypothetical protein